MIAPLVVVSIALSPQAPKQWPWPPPGARWETVPEQAFARARAERKPVFVYIATAD